MPVRRKLYTLWNGQMRSDLRYQNMGFDVRVCQALGAVAARWITPIRTALVIMGTVVAVMVMLILTNVYMPRWLGLLYSLSSLLACIVALLILRKASAVRRIEYYVFQSLVHAIAIIDASRDNWAGEHKKSVNTQLDFV